MSKIHNCLRYLPIIIVCSLFGATPATANSDGNSDAIRAIRNRYAVIEADARHYTTQERDLWGYSTEGGALTGYFLGPTLRKVVATFFGCSFHTVEEFYFDKNRLVFALITRSDYNQPLGAHILNTPPGNVVRISRDRFYFNNGRLVRRVRDGDQSIPLDTDEVKQDARDMLKELSKPK